uniref:Protein Lines N-terminal domain-containing protein n=2 Tax=Schistocephalus solidus TaxID=70667 RepID=A0A0X3NYR3_SCHSO
MTEFILYGSVKFSLTLKPSLFSSHESERLLAVVCNAAFSTNPDSTPLLQYLAASANVRSLEQSLLNLHPCRTLLYVIVRVAGSLNLESPRLPCLLDAFGRAVVAAAGSVNYLDHHSVTSLERDAVQIFLTDDVRLFRVLWTLLQLENKLLKAGVPVMDKVPSAHQLFAELLRAICFEHFTFLDWLVSPETDCLAFLLSYCKRIIASSKTAVELNVWALPMVPSPATHYRPDPSSSHDDASGWPSQEIVAFLRRLSASLRLHESEGTMPYSPRLLISRLQAAADVIANS